MVNLSRRQVLILGSTVPLLSFKPAYSEEFDRATGFAEFGDPDYPAGFTHFGYTNPVAPKGGDIRLSAYGTFERLDTVVLGPAWPQGIGLTSDSLMSGSSDENDAYYPSIAEWIEYPEDLSFAIFKIHDEARWQDGEPIKPTDFIANIEHIKKNARPLLRDFYKTIVDAEALDDRHLKINLSTKNNWRSIGLAASQSPMPVHEIERKNIDLLKPLLEPIVGAGGYKISKLDMGRSISYERIEDYWAKDLPINKGSGNFDKVTYIYFRDLDVAFEAFKSGEFDFWSENKAQRWVSGYDFPAAEDGTVIRDDTIADNVPTGFRGIVFNTRRDKFKNVKTREALSLLFDFEWTRKNIFYGLYQRAKSWFPNSDYGSRDFPLPEGMELEILEAYRGQIPEEIFTEAFVVNETDSSGRIRRELRQAWAMLKQAGYELKDKKLTDQETGRQLSIEIIVSQQSTLRVVQPYIENLKKAGIEAQARVVDSAQYQRITDDYTYDMIFIAANFFPPPGDEMRTYFHSNGVEEKGTGNWAGMNDPVIDDLLDKISDAPRQTESDLDHLKALTRALDRVLLRGYYIVPLYYNDKNRFAYWDLFAKPERHPFYGTGFPGTWWWQPSEKALEATGRDT